MEPAGVRKLLPNFLFMFVVCSDLSSHTKDKNGANRIPQFYRISLVRKNHCRRRRPRNWGVNFYRLDVLLSDPAQCNITSKKSPQAYDEIWPSFNNLTSCKIIESDSVATTGMANKIFAFAAFEFQSKYPTYYYIN